MDYPAYQAPLLPKEFIWRRLHSLTGLWLVLFLIEHLFTNSQAALYIGEDGSGFVKAVNFIREVPYLQFIEVFLLGIPFLIHGLWGIRYLLTAESNSFATNGSKPALAKYARNQAFTWQRLTSWILLFGVIAHVVQMRFLEYPQEMKVDGNLLYMNRVEADKGLYTLSERLGVQLYDWETIKRERLAALESWPLSTNQVIAASPSFGVSVLLMVRETFKSTTMIFLYSVFVLAACFHAFNGLWTFMISWGITVTARSQLWMRRLAVFLMVLVTTLGFAAIWGTYWFNLIH